MDRGHAMDDGEQRERLARRKLEPVPDQDGDGGDEGPPHGPMTQNPWLRLFATTLMIMLLLAANVASWRVLAEAVLWTF